MCEFTTVKLRPKKKPAPQRNGAKNLLDNEATPRFKTDHNNNAS